MKRKDELPNRFLLILNCMDSYLKLERINDRIFCFCLILLF